MIADLVLVGLVFGPGTGGGDDMGDMAFWTVDSDGLGIGNGVGIDAGDGLGIAPVDHHQVGTNRFGLGDGLFVSRIGGPERGIPQPDITFPQQAAGIFAGRNPAGFNQRDGTMSDHRRRRRHQIAVVGPVVFGKWIGCATGTQQCQGKNGKNRFHRQSTPLAFGSGDFGRFSPSMKT